MLLEVIKQWIRPGTTIVSDCWTAYDCLSSEGFVHKNVNHSKNLVDPTPAHIRKTLNARGGKFGAGFHVSDGNKNTWWVTWPNFSSNENIQLFVSGFTLSSLRPANSISLLPSSLIKPGLGLCFLSGWFRLGTCTCILVRGYVPTCFCFVVFLCVVYYICIIFIVCCVVDRSL